jgi:signal transduction histidine kinase
MLPLLRDEPEPSSDGEAARLVAIGAAGGTRLRLEGDLAALDAVADPAGSALRAALEQCVVNVARHAGVAEAWLAVAASATEVSVTVVDEGVGFDPDAVPHDRLGLSESVRGRIERCGGSVRVWSSPGSGTSVHLVVPRGG